MDMKDRKSQVLTNKLQSNVGASHYNGYRNNLQFLLFYNYVEIGLTCPYNFA
jgi:hypothetical protein